MEKVIGEFIPLRINKENQIDMFKKYLVSWTPTIALLDTNGKEHYRSTGFLSADEMCGRILLNAAKTRFDNKDTDSALEKLEEVIESGQGTFAVPEAVFYKGVAQYESSNQQKFLKEALGRLRKEFPDSEWTLKAKPYELLD